MASTARDRDQLPSVSAAPPAVPGSTRPAPRWLRGVGAMFRPASSTEPPPHSTDNELFAFRSEAAAAASPTETAAAGVGRPKAAAASRPLNRGFMLRRVIIPAVVVVAGIAIGLGLLILRDVPLPALKADAPRTGNLTIETRPIGAEVTIDGVHRGSTPLTVALMPGSHTLSLRSDADQRVIPLTIAAGAEMTQHIEMKTRDAAPLFGRISVVTDPPGAKVTVDGHPRGVSPLVVADLAADEHTVSVAGESGSVERKVVVTPAGTASLMFTLAPRAAGPLGGWLSVQSPFDVEIVEGADVIGSSTTSRVMLAAGRNEVVLANRSVGYQETKKIEVAAGRTTTLRVDPPQVTVSVNARPWAEILVDGASVGQTPIANLLVPVGSHDVVFRNPQHGDRRQTVVVTANGPNRITADLTK